MPLFNALFAADQPARTVGEPEWMPGPEEVARARAQMERQGIVRSVSRGAAAARLAPAGETPWLWLAAAALWVILWPAAIALKAAGQALTWLPWWLALLLAGLHIALLAGPVLLSERAGAAGGIRERFTKIQTVAQMLALEPSEFEAWTGMLFMLLGYRVRNTQDVADHGIDLQVTNARVRYGLVQCKRYRGTVGEPTVRDLYGTLIHEHADFGWLVTTGGVSRQARDWAAGKPLELWDGQKLMEYARSFRR
jgi:restriction system protein